MATNVQRQPWKSGAPDIGFRFVQHTNGDVCVYGHSGATVYFVPAAEVASLQMTSATSYVRRTPTWAVVLGIIGIFFFLLGLLFFLVKENVPYTVPSITVTTTAGHTLVFQGN